MDLNQLDLDALRAVAWLKHVEHHAVLDSTNSRGLELASLASPATKADARDLEVPRLIVADRQTAGRGRGANRWWTGEGALAVSLLIDLRPYAPSPAAAIAVSLCAGIAVCEAVRPRLPQETPLGLHWPNDVYAGGRKLSGVLIEARGGLHVVGIGLNVNNSAADAPAELADRVASLCDLAGRRFSRTKVLVDLLHQFAIQLDLLRAAPHRLGHDANRLCLQKGQTLRLDTGAGVVEGVCRDIAPDGALVLETPAGERRFYSGTLR